MTDKKIKIIRYPDGRYDIKSSDADEILTQELVDASERVLQNPYVPKGARIKWTAEFDD